MPRAFSAPIRDSVRGAIEGSLTRHQAQPSEGRRHPLSASATAHAPLFSATTMARPCEETTVTPIFKDALELAGGSGVEFCLENRGV
jgi:hypothetical protein